MDLVGLFTDGDFNIGAVIQVVLEKETEYLDLVGLLVDGDLHIGLLSSSLYLRWQRDIWTLLACLLMETSTSYCCLAGRT